LKTIPRKWLGGDKASGPKAWVRIKNLGKLLSHKFRVTGCDGLANNKKYSLIFRPRLCTSRRAMLLFEQHE
jgi:hypothetical protein